MGAAFVLLLVPSLMATLIMVTWMRKGAGRKKTRIQVGVPVLIAIISSWLFILSFGGLHPLGNLGLTIGLLVSVLAFFIPIFYDKF